MHAIRMLLLGTLLLQSNAAHSQVLHSVLFRPSSGPVDVFIDDQAREGCWTNISEVSQYTQDKLGLKGYQRTETLDTVDFFLFRVAVLGRRWGGNCSGSVKLEISTLGVANQGVDGKLVVAEYSLIVQSPSNFNAQVLEAVRELIELLPGI